MGLALIHANTLAIINDNNFGIGSSTASNGQLVGATVPHGSFQQCHSLEMGAGMTFLAQQPDRTIPMTIAV
ncbi:hypothetical protein [Pantanalinema sp. GBBB05]|uniref:hypothetical protein n=1 Tax=Pantanalinema sp. GBBB05 TaxID=2604139 RepID=UPI001D89B6AD|nr:hypothetical protein [Pantanalinema sp. GBBB05]